MKTKTLIYLAIAGVVLYFVWKHFQKPAKKNPTDTNAVLIEMEEETPAETAKRMVARG